MDPLLVVVGLDEVLVARLRLSLAARVVSYPNVPAMYSLDGQLYVSSASVAGRWLAPNGLVYYSYFENVRDARLAIALSDTPSFPDARATVLLDDKDLALIQCLRADRDGPAVARGYVPAHTAVAFDGTRVLKSGDLHCGLGKSLAHRECTPEHSSVCEPFFEGTSERVLLVGDRVWQLRYESDDWRKNVRATVREVPLDSRLVQRAQATAQRLGLELAGIDYLRTKAGDFLLEVNAYPALDDLAAVGDAFVEQVTQWWQRSVART
ncbi:MAG: hypothetical protein Q8Q09_20565 [Deltaproteobacteria bacterium]|nr:hypothetical protein [Deltaproteobacteria bacterium]